MPAVPIDEEELQARAASILREESPDSELGPITRLQGGTSSVTYWADYSGASATSKVVLKVAPAGLLPTKNRDVLRQANLQRALQATGVPCPPVLAQHPGSPPEVPPFYIMSFEDGECVEPNSLPESEAIPPEQVRSRELEAARILGILHSIDPDTLGLIDEPEIAPQDELERWSSSFAACDEDLQVGNEEVRDRLAAETPQKDRSTLIHGDFRLGNTLSKDTRVVSVIDWEIWARADPRVDLAWFLMMCNPDPELERPIAEGMPSTQELLDTYESSRGAEVKDMNWFNALARYKQAAITALLIRNARRRGETPTMSSPTTLLRSANSLLTKA